jgi:Phage integrase, N-terminal SAM-like domain
VSKKTPSQQDKFKSQPDRSISNAHPLRVLPGRVSGRPKPRPRGYGAPVADLAAAPAGAPREHRLKALASEWLLNLRVEGRSPRTLRWYRHHIDAYLGAGGVDDLSSLTAAELRRYVCELQDRGLSDDSVRGAFLSLKCMCNWAAREGYRIDAGLLRVRTPHVGEGADHLQRSAAGRHPRGRSFGLAQADGQDPAWGESSGQQRPRGASYRNRLRHR